MLKRTLTLALVPAVLASCQSAAPAARGVAGAARPGVYAKAFAGAGILQDEDVLFTESGGATVSGEGSFDAGYFGGVAVGYRFDEHWAAELEYAFRSNDVDRYTSGGADLATTGDFASTAAMLNGYYHFGTGWALDPYVGIGFGTATEVDIDLKQGTSFGGGHSFSGSTPAAQFMVGGTGALTERLGYFVEARFLRAFDPDLDEEGGGGNVESEYGHVGLMAGLQYAF